MGHPSQEIVDRALEVFSLAQMHILAIVPKLDDLLLLLVLVDLKEEIR